MGSSSQSGHVLVGFCYNPGLLEKMTVLEVKSHQVMVYSVRSGCEFELVSVYKGGKKKNTLESHFITHLPEGLCCQWHFKRILLVWFLVIKGKFWFIRFWTLFFVILVNLSIVRHESNLV